MKRVTELILLVFILISLSGCQGTKKEMSTPIPTSTIVPIEKPTEKPVSSNSADFSYSSSIKTKKCLKCGAPIYDDETWCDDCLFGSLDTGNKSTYTYDSGKTDNDGSDYDKYGNYKPVESMTSEEIMEELKSFFDD